MNLDFKYLGNYLYSEQQLGNIKLLIKPALFKKINDIAFKQLASIKQIPDIEEIVAFSDIQPGFGVPIGTCFTSSLDKAYISCEAIGFDINCGIRLIKTNLTKKDLSEDDLENLSNALHKLPIGLSKAGININIGQLDEILLDGIDWAIQNGFAKHKDKLKIDKQGTFKNAHPKCVSRLAKQRGIEQLGTLGEGNHFIDVMLVDEIFNNSCAQKYGLKKDQYCILLHTGSRGLGHQVGRDYYNIFENQYPISFQEFYSDLGQSYFAAMKAASNYAFVNRAVLSKKIEDVFIETLKISNTKLGFDLVYDLSHNYADVEEIDGQKKLIHRKGVIRTYCKNNVSKRSPYSTVGNPVILPASMLDYSYVLKPLSDTAEFLNSAPHGCGRLLSRSEAKDKINFTSLKRKLKNEGILLNGKSQSVMREEQPRAYKKSKDVVQVMEKNKLASKVCKLKPKIVITG